jgi:hypothetical protein
MSALNRTIRREWRVAVSRNPQPSWLRVLKWLIIIAVCLALWPTAHLWWWIGGATITGLGGHLFYRWKTHGWTRGWGGWDHAAEIDRE